MSEIKTKRNEASVEAFLRGVDDEQKQKDAFVLLELFEQCCGVQAEMWGESIVGFGSYHYKYASGQEGDWMLAGFSPRKTNLTLYLMLGSALYESLLPKLGKHKTSKGSCLYINKLKDVDLEVLKEIITLSYSEMNKKYNG